MIEQITNLEKLLLSSIPFISTTADKATKLVEELQSGNITKDEFDELIDSLTSLDVIEKDMFELSAVQDVQQAINVIMALKGMASL